MNVILLVNLDVINDTKNEAPKFTYFCQIIVWRFVVKQSIRSNNNCFQVHKSLLYLWTWFSTSWVISCWTLLWGIWDSWKITNWVWKHALVIWVSCWTITTWWVVKICKISSEKWNLLTCCWNWVPVISKWRGRQLLWMLVALSKLRFQLFINYIKFINNWIYLAKPFNWCHFIHLFFQSIGEWTLTSNSLWANLSQTLINIWIDDKIIKSFFWLLVRSLIRVEWICKEWFLLILLNFS